MIDKKPSDIFHVITANGNQVQRLIVSKDLQIGTENNPAEIHLTGRMSQSVKTLSGPGGSQFSFPGNVAIVNVICTSQSGNMTITLPAGPRDGQTCYVKDASGTASKCNIIIKGTSSKVDGKDSYTINVAYGSVGFVWGSTGWLSLGGGSNSESTATYDGLVDPVSVALPADSDGVVTSYTSAKTYVYGYKGSKELKSTTSTPGADQFSVTASGTSIFPGAQAQNTTENPAVFLPSGMNSASDTAKIEYTLTFEDGSTKKLIQNFTKSKNGANGTNGTNGTDGRDAYGSTLTPPSVVFAADAAGTVSSYSNGTATIRVFKGSTELNSVTAASTPGVDEFNVTAAGTNITPGSYSFAATDAAFSAVSNMTADTAYVTYTVTIGTSTGTTTQTLVQNFAKAKRGTTGSSATDIIVAGGSGTTNTLAYSTDGAVSWTGLGTSTFGVSCNAIVWTGRMWVATGEGNAAAPGANNLAYSFNGVDWINKGLSNIPGGIPGAGIVGYGLLTYVPKGSTTGKKIFIVGDEFRSGNWFSVIGRSNDNGASWTDITGPLPASFTNTRFRTIIQCGSNSTTGAGSSGANRIIVAGVCTGGAIAAGSGDLAYTDNNGTSWTAVNLAPGAGGPGFLLDEVYAMATNDSRIIAVGNGGGLSSNSAMYSDDAGGTWSPLPTQPFASNGTGYGIFWNGYYWVAVGVTAGGGRRIMVSDDNGITWSASSGFILNGSIKGLCWTGDRWVFTGSESSTNQRSIVYTTTPDASTGYTAGDSVSAGIFDDNSSGEGRAIATKLIVSPGID